MERDINRVAVVLLVLSDSHRLDMFLYPKFGVLQGVLEAVPGKLQWKEKDNVSQTVLPCLCSDQLEMIRESITFS